MPPILLLVTGYEFFGGSFNPADFMGKKAKSRILIGCESYEAFTIEVKFAESKPAVPRELGTQSKCIVHVNPPPRTGISLPRKTSYPVSVRILNLERDSANC